jgi:RimJ/RimL family protein N-acetyltransferase
VETPQYTKENAIYSWKNLIVAPSPPEALLGEIYLRLAKEDLLGQVFYEGIPSLAWFLERFQKPDTDVLACFRRDGENALLSGLGWINNVKQSNDGYRRAEVGIAFFRHQLRSIEFGKMMLAWFFENREVDFLYGCTPEPNRPAWRYAKALGFTLHGPIPNFTSWKGEACGVMISALSRKDWNLSTRV